MLRLAFFGPAGTGKTTCAQYCAEKYGGEVLSFATPLKQIAMHQLGWDGKKDKKGRRLLQELGWAARSYNENFWADKLVSGLKVRGSYFIDDLRFPSNIAVITPLRATSAGIGA